MKRLTCFVLALFLGINGAVAATEQDAVAVAKNVADDLVKNVMQAKLSVPQKREMFRNIFLDDADMDTITKFILGRAFKTATPEQVSSFKKTFTENFVLTWADRFNTYSGEDIVFTGARQSAKDFYVTSEIIIKQGEKPIALIWRLRETANGLKVVDLVAEGVSMLQNYRKEYDAVLQQNNNDIDTLTKMIAAKNESLKTVTK